MKVKPIILLLSFSILLFINGCTKPPVSSEISKGDFAAVKREVSSEINKLMKKYKVQGLSIALVDDQKIIWAEGFGHADVKNKISATAETVYRIGSISKLFTATAAMQLVEQGKVNLDHPITDYVPEFSIKSRFDDAGPITPRNLMTHHSGLPGDILKGFFVDEADHYSSVFSELKNEYTAYPPNYIFSYSNLGMSLVGYMVEKVSGVAFPKYMDENLFEPMGMEHSSFETPDDLRPLLSKGYNVKKEGKLADIRDVPAGSMVSNVLDMSQFIKMVFADGKTGNRQILNPETLGKMLTKQNENVPLDLDFSIGLGWWLTPEGLGYAGKVASHGGATEVFRSKMILLVDHKIGVVILTNSSKGNRVSSKVAKLALKLALKAKTGINPPEKKNTVQIIKTYDGDLSDYAGLYVTPAGPLNIQVVGNELKTKINGKIPLTFLPNNNGTFTPKIIILKLFSKKLYRQQFMFKTVANENLLVGSVDGLSLVFGKKIEKPTIPQSWINRSGKYEIINLDTERFYYDKPTLVFNEGMLLFRAKLDKNHYEMLLKPINDYEAINIGLGRNMNETIQVIETEDGHELLKISGFLLKKLKD